MPTIIPFIIEVRGHVYRIDIFDQRKYREIQKRNGERSDNLISPYSFIATCFEKDLEVDFRYIRRECRSKPSKKSIKDAIEHVYQQYDKILQQYEEERIKEQQRLVHEAWLDEPATITNRQYEKIMERLLEIERELQI